MSSVSLIATSLHFNSWTVCTLWCQQLDILKPAETNHFECPFMPYRASLQCLAIAFVYLCCNLKKKTNRCALDAFVVLISENPSNECLERDNQSNVLRSPSVSLKHNPYCLYYFHSACPHSTATLLCCAHCGHSIMGCCCFCKSNWSSKFSSNASSPIVIIPMELLT